MQASRVDAGSRRRARMSAGWSDDAQHHGSRSDFSVLLPHARTTLAIAVPADDDAQVDQSEGCAQARPARDADEGRRGHREWRTVRTWQEKGQAQEAPGGRGPPTCTRNGSFPADPACFAARLIQPTLNAKTSRKVLTMARDQQDELAHEDNGDLDWEDEVE